VTDCIMTLKSKGSSKKLFHSMDQVKGTDTCYSLSFIDMYYTEARDFATEDVELAQRCYCHEESQSMRSYKEKMWYNLMNMMKDVEAYEQLAWEQYGSREGKNVIDQAVNKVLSFDLIQQVRAEVAMCSNDANS
jgi:hypothetical protein